MTTGLLFEGASFFVCMNDISFINIACAIINNILCQAFCIRVIK